MIRFDVILEVYIVKGVTDLRKGIDRYTSIIQELYQISPFQDALFIFCNRHRNKIKCPYWDGNVFWLLYKRLEKRSFSISCARGRNDYNHETAITMAFGRLKNRTVKGF